MARSGVKIESSRQYYPQLDSLRGLSFLAIFLYHVARTKPDETSDRNFFVFVLENCNLGIDVFFVLSSFLLTSLALNEIKSDHEFSIKNYIIRRTLRIWPLYYTIMIFAFLALPLVSSLLHIQISLPPPGWYLFFISNFYHVDHVYFLRILWSLSVEEQLYIILGLLFTFIPKNLGKAFALFIVISILFISYAIINHISFYSHTLTYLLDFGAGGLTAVILFNKEFKNKYSSELSAFKKTALCLYLPIHLTIFYFLDKYSNAETSLIYQLCNRLLIIIYIAVLIFQQVADKNKESFLATNKFLLFTGKISFGLYCFHGIINTLTDFVFPDLRYLSVLKFCFVLGLTYITALLSYTYLESFFLRLKNRFRSKKEALPDIH